MVPDTPHGLAVLERMEPSPAATASLPNRKFLKLGLSFLEGNGLFGAFPLKISV